MRAFVACCLLLWPTVSWAHPDIHEDRLLSHFAAGVHRIEKGLWDDATHSLTARVQGEPKLATIGPTEALAFDGQNDWLLLADSPEKAGRALPKKEFSVAAWVNLASTTPFGGIVGLVQDNGDYEKGWALGYNDTYFSFDLATKGAEGRGRNRLTFLSGNTQIEPGRWYYVVGVYDGSTMRLYVNGQLDAESREQSGDIDYPPQGRYVIGGFIDDNEKNLLDGAVYEVKTYGRALEAKEIEQTARKNDNLIRYESTAELAFVVQPYLQFGTTTGMTVMCETNRPTTMTVEFGERQPLGQKTSSREARYISELELTGLQPHTSYFYRVTCSDGGGRYVVSELSSFQTAPTADMPWAFAIIGDTQRNPEVTGQCMAGAYALRPNFLLHCGDVVDDGHAKHQWVKDLLQPSAVLMSRVPTFPVIGNHEKNSHWYYDYFSLPAPEYHYTFTYGNAQFFMIDSNKPLAPGSEQYRWLEAELAKSKATWKFTCHHHPCFSSDADDYGDRVKGEKPGPMTWGDTNARQLVSLYEKHGVDMAFNGHIHAYERTWPIYQMTINQQRGVRYLTSGGGGGSLEETAPQRSWFSLHFKRAYHYCYVTAFDRTIQLKAYDLEGRLFDTFELTKPADR